MSEQNSSDFPNYIIAHVDVDAFFAQVAVMDNPKLAGLPVAVAHLGRRSVVTTASYPAREFGVHSALPLSVARQRCPNLIVVEPTFERYRELSEKMMQVFKESVPSIEPASMDEAYLDLTTLPFSLETVKDVTNFLEDLRTRVHENSGLTVSAGAGSTKMIAKLASAGNKPDGVLVVSDKDSLSFIAQFDVSAVSGIGPVTTRKLNDLGIASMTDLANASDSLLAEKFPKNRRAGLLKLAKNDDDRRVETSSKRKSMSSGSTFPHDLKTHKEQVAAIETLAKGLTDRLLSRKIAVSTVSLRWRTPDFTDFSKAHTFNAATDDVGLLVDALVRLLPEHVGDVRLLEVSFSTLTAQAQGVLPLHFKEKDGLAVGLPAIHKVFGEVTVVALMPELADVSCVDGTHKTVLREFLVPVF